MNGYNIVQWLKITLVASFVIIFIAFHDAIAKPHLTVIVPNFPPYTLKSNNKISGIGIDLANKVFKQAGIIVDYRILPNYAKALYEIEQGRGDAILLVSKNEERDKIAVFTKPLMVNRWCWYLLNNTSLNPYDDGFKQNAKTSSHYQANTHKWLIANDYNVEPAMQVGKLPKMLQWARVDAVFIAELVFEETIKRNNLDLKQFKKYVEIEKPFGIYISKTYLAQHPEILGRVNQAIDLTIADSL